MRDRKNIKKKVVKGMRTSRPRRVTRRPVRRVWEDGRMGQARFGTPRPRQAGRADCLRFASPAEATWRLEALRLGGLEAWRIRWPKLVCHGRQMKKTGRGAHQKERKRIETWGCSSEAWRLGCTDAKTDTKAQRRGTVEIPTFRKSKHNEGEQRQT